LIIYRGDPFVQVASIGYQNPRSISSGPAPHLHYLCLMRLLFLLALLSISDFGIAQRNIFDGFDNNDNGWPVGIADANMLTVHDGVYTVVSSNEGFFNHTFNVRGGFNQHFRIEVSVGRDSLTRSEKGAGITWGKKGDSTSMTFLVYGDGSFVFQNRVNGKLDVVSPNSFHYAYNGFGFNNIRVDRNMETNKYDFSINEQLVLSVPYVQPASDEAGIYADMGGAFQFDNFWFIEQANAITSYVPHSLSMEKRCGDGDLKYESDYGYSYCVPFGWRVDEYKETHQTVWPVGCPYVINIDYTKLAIEDSFSIAARNDWKIFSDSLDVKERVSVSFRKDTSQAGVEVYEGIYNYQQPDGNSMITYRYYVFDKKSGGFMLVECVIPPWEENLNMDFHVAAANIAETAVWE